METLVKLTCKKCGESFDDKKGPCNGNNNSMSVFIDGQYGYNVLGKTKDSLCPDCLIRAQIKLRNFLIESEYFTGEEPF